MDLSRRNFLKLGAAAGVGGVFGGAHSLSAQELATGGRGVSSATGNELKAVPSACWGCVTRDGMIGYVEDGRLKKLEGNPKLPRTNGKLCSKGQAGVNIVYNPDRLLYPLKRVGKRGEGKWQRLTHQAALDLLVNGGDIAGRKVKGLKTLRDEGTPEQFMFHYGRMKGSDGKIIKSNFLPAYGTGTIGNHTSICESAKWTAQELTWGAHYDNWDLDNTKFILNFGSNVLEAHTNHVPMAQRCSSALARGVKMYTFDVRLSNTAAKSTEWVPIRPGTDLAVVLAMCNVLLENNIADKDFIETYTNVTVAELKKHVAQYTPEWAEKISSVPAAKIRAIALEYGRTRPSVCLSYRGAVTHYNGVQAERAIFMLEALAGNIDIPGGRCRAVGAKWKVPSYSAPKVKAKKLKIVDGFKGAYAAPSHHVSHQVLPVIKKGPLRPHIYMTYCYNPAYVNGNCQESIEILKDENLIPFLVSSDVALTEVAELADLVLPDATYLERWACDDMVCANQVPEFYIRQPMHKPLGDAQNLCDTVCELSKMLGFDLGFNSAEEFVQRTCDNTPGVKEAGGFAYMKANGAWVDPAAKPKYLSHAKEVDVTGATLDEATGVYYKKAEGDTDYSSLDKKHAAKQYVAQKCGGKAVKGFPPDKHLWKTGIMELKSKTLADKGFDAIPGWMEIPEHAAKGADDLILTTYKVNVQVHSRSQSSKWLNELYHRNPALINPATARARGIRDGGKIKVTTEIGTLETRARVTEGIHPDVIAISNHCGHWAYAEYASLKETHGHKCEPDCDRIWWRDNGAHPNWIIPNVGDPIGGGLRWMDTVAKVEKA